MNAKVKLGCLRNAEGLPTPLHAGGSFKQWVETYEFTKLDMPLPDQGTKASTLPCPVCSQTLTIKLASPGLVYSLLQWALGAVALVCFVMAAFLFFAPLNDRPALLHVIAGCFAAVGVAASAVALFCERLPPDLLKSELVKISNDEVRNHAQGPSYSGMRGHKILEVRLS